MDDSARQALAADLRSRLGACAKDLSRGLDCLQIEHGGETIRLGELSPGCALCKEGRWDCLFITDACNLACDFCLSPALPSARMWLSALGESWEETARHYAAANIAGCSYSGGEPLLDKPRLESVHSKLRRAFPQNYYWLYTNGLLLDEDTSRWLADAGIDEVRVNTAATGYSDPRVLDRIGKAARLLKRVTVEIPLIAEDLPDLLDSLPRLADLGVTYLNLHDLLSEADSRSGSFARASFLTLTLPDGHQTGWAEEACVLAAAVLGRVHERRIPLQVNYCSIFSQLRQLRQRRGILRRLLAEPYHRPWGEELWEFALVRLDDGSQCPVHPDRRESSPDCRGRDYSLIREFVPLSVQEYAARCQAQPWRKVLAETRER